MAHRPSQQNQQSQSQNEPNISASSGSGSPRRRNPPLDLDTALYLQSQASYVQTPSNRSSPLSNSNRSSGTPTQTSINHRQQQQQQQQQQQTASNNIGDSFNFAPIYGHNYGDHIKSSDNHGRAFNNYSSNNISVDYIDCISNNDLVPAADGLNRGSNMRGIPSCRKHLRFHRNRIEPSLCDPMMPATNQATSSSNGAFNQHQQQSLADGLTTTGGDASSNITSISDGSNQMGATTSGTSVLYPISVTEAKKRTYLIGSVSQDSLLGQDELYRYFPSGRVSIFVCTWNQNRKRAPMNLNDLLLPDQLVYVPDIYAIGIQEAFSSQTDYLKEWDIELQTVLGPNHVLLHSCSLGVLHLSLFVRRDLIWFCSMPEESVYNSRSMPTNMIKTKGAISIAFRFFGTSFMFTNCHFPAHENKLKDRIDEYQRIINSIDLPKNFKLLKPRYLSNDSTARFDCVFFMGDLNFRLEQRTFDETIYILEDIFQQKEPSYEALTQNDELLKVMESDQAFHGFDESQIKFPPTYKFLAQTNKYDRQTKRVPSYTDRILFRSKRQRHIQCLIYDWLPQLLSSDHKPVYCLFDVLVRPGHEQNMVSSLNAGLFQRAIYLEALKRRAEDPDSLRENGAGGSLICSIS